MNTYVCILLTTGKEYLAYRLNFILWRFRILLGTAVSLFLWLAVFDSKTAFGNYTKERMLSYILFSSLVTTFISSSRTPEIASDIQSGDIINKLLRPFSLFRFHAIQDGVDKLINLLFGTVEFLFLVFVFSIPLVAPKDILFFLFFLFCGLSISFFINLILSSVGFWTPDVWAPRFLFIMIVFFVSGAYFPLDLLPEPLYRLLLLTPFPYLYFLPTKTLVDGIQRQYFIQQAACSVIWVYVTYLVTRLVWNKGIKEFSFWGR